MLNKIIPIILLIVFNLPQLSYAFSVDSLGTKHFCKCSGNDGSFICYCCLKDASENNTNDNKPCYKGGCKTVDDSSSTLLNQIDPALIAQSYWTYCYRESASIFIFNQLSLPLHISPIEKPPA